MFLAHRAAAEGKNKELGWGESAYVVSKVGVTALTKIQQRQFDSDSREGIVVNAVHPGFVATDMSSYKGPLTTEQGRNLVFSHGDFCSTWEKLI